MASPTSTPSGAEWFDPRVTVANGERAVVAARRITERNGKRGDLRRQQAHLSQAREIARIGSRHRHSPSSELWWSEMVSDIFGRSREVGRSTHETFLSAVHPGDRERTRISHSSGLGPWLTRWIVGNAGGTLDIRDGRNGGTVVTVDLPRVDADELS